jgi:hypothetical protein
MPQTHAYTQQTTVRTHTGEAGQAETTHVALQVNGCPGVRQPPGYGPYG